jgi:hypothetical protein
MRAGLSKPAVPTVPQPHARMGALVSQGDSFRAKNALGCGPIHCAGNEESRSCPHRAGESQMLPYIKAVGAALALMAMWAAIVHLAA